MKSFIILKTVGFILVLVFHLSAAGQPPDFGGRHPVLLIDGIPYDLDTLKKINQDDIAKVVVLKDSAAMSLVRSAQDGLILVTTRKGARLGYWRFFCSKSEEYAKLITEPGRDEGTAYIVNGKLLENNIEVELIDINHSNFNSLTVIDQEELINKYQIYDKPHGIVITTKTIKRPPARLPSENKKRK